MRKRNKKNNNRLFINLRILQILLNQAKNNLNKNKNKMKVKEKRQNPKKLIMKNKPQSKSHKILNQQ